jgi:hypothetical protein
MPFYSEIQDIPVLSADSDLGPVRQSGEMAGYEERQDAYGSQPFAAPFSLPLIPRSEWRERIEEMTRTKTRISDMAAQVNWKPKHQARTLYCWINGVTMAKELARIIAGQPHVPLSPASVGAPINGYRNAGGWGTKGIAYGSEHGWVPESMWPANAIDRRYDTPETRAIRAKYQVDDWVDCRPGNFDQAMTMLLLRRPGLRADMRWSHLVACMDPLYLPNGRFAMLCPNSGLGRDRNGYTVLDETFGRMEEIIFVSVTT